MPRRDDVIDDVKLQTGYVLESFKNMVTSLQWMTAASRDKAFTKGDPSPGTYPQSYFFGMFPVFLS